MDLMVARRGSLDFGGDDGLLISNHLSLFALRHRQARKNPLNNRLACNRFRFCLVADDDAMTQNIRTDALDVLRRDVAATIQERMRSSSESEVYGGARRGAITDQTFKLQIVSRRFACRPNDIDDIILHPI